MSYRACSLTTWFKLPQQGMKSWEVLTRGSAVSISMKPGATPTFLTSGRSIAPFIYRQFFPNADWLEHVSPENCRYTIQLGPVATSSMTFELAQDSVLHHPDFDVAALSIDLEDEDRFMKANMSDAVPILLSSSLSSSLPEEHTSVVVAGHDVSAASNTHQSSVLDWEDCTILACTDSRGLVKVPAAVPESFSGGGVFSGEVNGEVSLYGILEGELPPDKDTPELVENFHCATFVSASGIRKWLLNPESATSTFE